MTVGTLDRRTATMLVVGVLAVVGIYAVVGQKSATVVAPADSIPLAEKRLERLRQVAATVPGKEAVLKQVTGELDKREKDILKPDTAPQAQAQLLELIRRNAMANGIDARGAEELRVRALPGGDYGEVMAGVTFTCGIEQLVNFLAALANDPAAASNEIHIAPGDPKQKTVQVRLSVSGVVPKKLVPEKKGGAQF